MAAYAGVVLAAGRGTRMKSKVPKVLHGICGREMVRLAVDCAADAGLSPIVVVTPPSCDAIREVLGDDVIYVEQKEPLGSGHALLQARSAVRPDLGLFVINGDVPLVTPRSVRSLITAHREHGAAIAILTATVSKSDGLGRVLRSDEGIVTAVVEEWEAEQAARSVSEINVGAYCFSVHWMWENLSGLPASSNGEVALTGLIGLAVSQGRMVETVTVDAGEALSVNTRVQLAEAEAVLRQRIREQWMLAGVSMPDPSAVYVDTDAEIGEDTTIYPNTHVRGRSRIGRECEIGPNSVVADSTVGDGCRVVSSVVEGSTIDDRVAIGPFSRVREGSRLMDGVYIGNYAEIKDSLLDRGTKVSHFSYVGDAQVGSNVNIGAGAVTCNFDGVEKSRTIIGDDAFIGSDSMLVAPVNIGAGATTGAGSVITRDVPPDHQAIGVPARVRRKRTDPA